MGEKRMIDAKSFAEHLERMARTAYPNLFPGLFEAAEYAKYFTTVDAVEVVRCKECRWAKSYKRMDGKTGYYCQFFGNSFKYGTNCEHLYNPAKESDDFCSYGERKDGDGNG